MGSTFDGIDERLERWIARQRLFFVATAPLARDGHINASPKGPIGTLRVLDPTTVAYLDLTGSGAETIAHLRENGRIVIMLCAFEGPPRIVRLYGHGEAIFCDDDRFSPLLAQCRFVEPGPAQARRAIVQVKLTRIADSCGYGVPLMNYESERPHMDAWAAKKLRVGGDDAIAQYRAQKNAQSIDGLPAVEPAASAEPNGARGRTTPGRSPRTA